MHSTYQPDEERFTLITIVRAIDRDKADTEGAA